MYSRFPARARLPRRGYLIPFIALSLDGVFRGCFALGFSPLIVRFISFQGNCKRFKTFHFNPEEAALQRVSVTWCDWKGKPQGVVTPVPSVQMVSSLMAKASPSLLSFRNPDAFVAGELHRHVDKWEEILAQHPKQDEILSYIKYKVNVKDFFTRFRGDFQGTFYDSPCPPRAEFSNNKSCLGFEDFISSTILERVKNGSLSVWGRVGEDDPPHLVMPLTIEPSKPRLCHDERFLNLWIRDLPLKLDYISDLPRYVGKYHFQTTMDDKSGYDHVEISEESRKYFGLQWQGWYFVYNTIPFGWKGSAYVYHSIGMAATSYIRSLGVPCSQYIDDRHVGQLSPPPESRASAEDWSDLEFANAAIFIAAFVLISLGYFIGLSKSSLIPARVVKFLGFLVDSQLCAFLLPEDKKIKFATLREHILANREVSVKTLQRLAGKISSFCIAVPAALLYARDIFRSTAGFTRSSRLVRVTGALRKEIEHWRFLDSWEGCLPWLNEKHVVVKISSDASNSGWGGSIVSPGLPPFEVRDYWTSDTRSHPIVVKEALAFVNTLQAGKSLVTNARVDAHTDSLAFLQSWEKQGGRNVQLNDALKKLHETAFALNAVISLKYVPSSANPADPPSRVLSDLDCTLSRKAWRELEQKFGPHTIDLMSLDSNAQIDSKGKTLRHFTPFFTPHSLGVNVFAQTISPAENAYVFPPFVLVGPLLRFLLESELCFSIVVPKLYPLPFWWPILVSRSHARLQLGSKEDLGILLFPSRNASFESRPLPWDLFAFRVASGK